MTSRLTEILAVPCPSCGADAGLGCVSRNGKFAVAHAARRDASRPTHGRRPPPPAAPPRPGANLGDAISARRVTLGISKAEAARRAGVSRRTWHEVEDGTRSTSTAVTLAQFDQALRWPEGTLYGLTARSDHDREATLRRRAEALVMKMGSEEMELFLETGGRETFIGALHELRGELRDLKADVLSAVRQGVRHELARQLRLIAGGLDAESSEAEAG